MPKVDVGTYRYTIRRLSKSLCLDRHHNIAGIDLGSDAFCILDPKLQRNDAAKCNKNSAAVSASRRRAPVSQINVAT
jgi:hypothetical protein